MKLKQSTLMVAACFVASPSAYADHLHVDVPEVEVAGQRNLFPFNRQDLDISADDRASARDSAALLQSTPGAAVIRHGQQTGMVQLHGMTQERVRVLVDGMDIAPACPNHMDPPLHYISAQEVETMQVMAGVTPVSQGGDSIGGSVIANAASPYFGQDSTASFAGRVYGGYSGSNDGYDAGLRASIASDRMSFGVNGERLHGGDYESARGRVLASGYDTWRHRAQIALRGDAGAAKVTLARHHSWDVGTPALGMDMTRDDATTYALDLVGNLSFGTLTTKLYRHDIDHVMDNYSLRTTAMASRMAAPSTSDNKGGSLKLEIPHGGAFGVSVVNSCATILTSTSR